VLLLFKVRGRSEMTQPPPLRCPPRNSCVCTLATDPRHRIEPIPFTGTLERAQRRLAEVLRSLPGMRIVSEEPGRIVAESRSRVFRFVDDLDLRLDERAGLIHFRARARVGSYDFGVNRRRMELVRRRYSQGIEPS
jgi:uncharacterized protein (DUF1499 family)